MKIHINDNQTEATINGVEYLLTPKETTVSKTYTIEQLKSEKIAVRCENLEQLKTISSRPDYFNFLEDKEFPLIGLWDISVENPRWAWTEMPESDDDSKCFITKYNYKTIPFSQVQFPEKRDWEITAYKVLHDVFRKQGNYFWFGYASMSEAQLIEHRHPIHSVLRSDGVEFTVGDEVKEDTCMNRSGIIKSLEQKDNLIWVTIGDNTSQANLMYLNKVSKPSKKVLFKTEDGVEVFDDDEYFYILPEHNALESDVGNEGFPYETSWQGIKRFKHRENALQYISDNKPEYSKRQILEALESLKRDNKIEHSLIGVIKHKLSL